MNNKRDSELKQIYSSLSDEALLERLSEGKNVYEEDAYTIMLNEAKKRGLEIPAEKTSASFEYVKRKVIFCTSSVAEAALIASLLKSNGIDAYTQDSALSRLQPLITNAIGGIKITVPENQYQDGCKILEEYAKDNFKDVNFGNNNPL